MLVKVEFRLVPSVVTAVMMTTAIKATIRPYSMAVAPDSSARKPLRTFVIRLSPYCSLAGARELMRRRVAWGILRRQA